MQVVVKKPRIEMTGDISKRDITYLRRAYGKNNVEIIEETFDIESLDWYKKIKASITPSDKVKALRHRDGMTRSELAKKMKEKISVISAIEKGEKEIDDKIAEKLGEAFNITKKVFLSA